MPKPIKIYRQQEMIRKTNFLIDFYIFELLKAEAVKHGNVEILEYLFDCGASVSEIIGDSRMTLLHLAASYGHDAIIKMLVEKGGNIHARTIR